jgi:hypothetical protein
MEERLATAVANKLQSVYWGVPTDSENKGGKR